MNDLPVIPPTVPAELDQVATINLVAEGFRELHNVAIADIKIGNRFRKSVGDIAGLAESMKDVGLLHSIVSTPELELVAGARRIAAAQQLGWTTIPAIIADSLTEAVDLLRAERDENTCRQPFTIEEAVALGEAIEAAYRPVAEEKAAQGRKEGGKKAGKGRPLSSGKSSPKAIRNESARTTAQAAEAAGMSRPTYEKAKVGMALSL